MDDKVNVTEAAAALTEFWSQETLAEANGQLIKVAKGIGETRWHAHDDQDETFLVLSGRLTVSLRDRDIPLDPGDLFVVPQGVEHRPFADEETRFVIMGRTITSTAAGGKPDWSAGDGRPPAGE
jgi:mannose-6-phosphate isomerase-like protein (cupin superfamily)